ncbi:unnamed protein product [Aphis gossypii]|uniref:Uncharacterized protein n=1 Tax=Aphis gossypii TaxID=80765 RepID=A0A9P0ND28_APHGO|nr:unnamed protein product [Aphis gossypii]
MTYTPVFNTIFVVDIKWRVLRSLSSRRRRRYTISSALYKHRRRRNYKLSPTNRSSPVVRARLLTTLLARAAATVIIAIRDCRAAGSIPSNSVACVCVVCRSDLFVCRSRRHAQNNFFVVKYNIIYIVYI